MCNTLTKTNACDWIYDKVTTGIIKKIKLIFLQQCSVDLENIEASSTQDPLLQKACSCERSGYYTSINIYIYQLQNL